MLIPICQVGEFQAYSGDIKVTAEKIDGWVRNFGEHEKVPIGMGHNDPNYTLADTDKKPYCWISGLCRAGDFCMAMLTDWTPEGQTAALNNEFKNFSIETTGGDEDRIKYVAALGAYDSAVDFKTPDGERFQPFDFTRGALGETGRLMLAAALGAESIVMPYKTPPARIKKLFADEKGPKIWTAAFNSAYEKYKDEGRASKIAWGAVENAGYEKGEDGKWRKTKKAAEAAKGEKMAEDQAAKAAEEKKSVLATLANWLGFGETPPAELVALAKPEPEEVKALAARVDELDKQVKSQAAELQMAGATTQAADLCRRAHLPPKFEQPIAEYLAGKAEITLAEPEVNEKGEVVKEHKLSRNNFFDRLLEAKGTAKLEDPAALTKPPKKAEVKPFAGEKEGEVSDERKAEIAKEARAEALAAGKGDDQVFVKDLIVAKMNAEVK